MDFSSRLLEETGVFLTPGVVYGQSGEGYLRVSITTPEERLREAAGRMAKFRF
jgi:LL-diaminopimelate aminotransferase